MPLGSPVTPCSRSLDRVMRSYDRFVPHELMRLTGRTDITGVALGDHVEKRMTILFSDIRNYTTFSESLTPEENFRFLNSYLLQVDPIIGKHRGIVDKYIGDAVMAVFTEDPNDAVRGALDLLRWLKVYNAGRKKAGYVPISIGIGLNTGILMLGTVGGPARMDYTVLGNSVNLASRLEAMTKEYGVPLLISEHTLRVLPKQDAYCLRFIDRLNPKGITHPVSIYEVFDDDPPEMRMAKMKTRDTFQEAVAHFHYKRIAAAERLFRKCLEEFPNDTPCHVYLNRCKRYRASGSLDRAGELNRRVRWKSEWEVGIGGIDRQHRSMFDQAQKIINLSAGGKKRGHVEKYFRFLWEYTAQHFADEERLLKKISYPFLEEQKLQHRMFIRELTGMQNTIGSLASRHGIYAVFQIQILIIGWIVQHIMAEDQHYARFIRNRRKNLKQSDL